MLHPEKTGDLQACMTTFSHIADYQCLPEHNQHSTRIDAHNLAAHGLVVKCLNAPWQGEKRKLMWLLTPKGQALRDKLERLFDEIEKEPEELSPS